MSVGAGGIFLLAWTFTVNAFYSSTNVIKLTSINFNSQVIQSDKLWLVEFYVHWCEHCEQFAPEWIKVASALKGIVKVGAIDVTKYVSIGHQYEIEEFPTIKFFGVNKNKPEKYYGGRSSAAIANGVLNSIRFTIRERLMEKSRMCASERQCRQIMNKDAFELNDRNFDNQVTRSDEIWIVEFYAPWCEHCLSQEPAWTNAVVELTRRTKGKIHLAAVDTTVNVMLATRFRIQQVPMIKIFQANKEVVDYNGEKSTPSIIAAGLNLYSKISLYKPFEQMVNEEIFKTVCDLQVLCIIAVLPHISETGNSGRSDYLSLLMKIAHKYKKKKWGWLWTESGAQPKLENALGIDGLKFPNIISIDARRKKYMLLRGSFSERRISEFFRKLSLGHVSRIPISNDFSKVKTVKRWDSMGGELPKEDSILSGPSFQELENDEL
ncbi:protein disulfide-isomerase A6-like isoform X1 [Narcine bancroftii]|uniref:protein disulfide-isomerase A6-like isoform X1 n=1 Tax=Narcine bancroftii TaxID=1343680 RepID=UPI0038317C7C